MNQRASVQHVLLEGLTIPCKIYRQKEEKKHPKAVMTKWVPCYNGSFGLFYFQNVFHADARWKKREMSNGKEISH